MKTLAISPCPNDTYAFFGWLCGHVPGPEVNVEFHDIEALNQMCFARQADICKVSFHAFLHASESYAMLPVGAALGFGCGPLLVCREEHLNAPLETLRVVSPGRWTTANLLLELWGGPRLQLSYMPFDEIMDAVSARRADAGLIIHESRFTYEQMGLVQRVDLGSWWETHAQAPIPLGGLPSSAVWGVTSRLRWQRRSAQVCNTPMTMYGTPMRLWLGMPRKWIRG